MSGIDYSKWDRMEFSDSDDDDHQRVQQPRVTRLDQPSRITTTPSGQVLVETATPSTTAVSSPPTESLSKQQQQHAPKDGCNNREIPKSWTEKGGVCDNTSSPLMYYWSQDRDSVTLRMSITTTKDVSCTITNLLPYKDRHLAVSNTTQQSLVVRQGNRILLQDDLVHPVHLAEDDDDEVDWSIQCWNNKPYLQIILYKAVPMEGVTLWWKRPLQKCLEIELTWRQQEEDSSSGGGFQQAWKEAHEQFKQKMAKESG